MVEGKKSGKEAKLILERTLKCIEKLDRYHSPENACQFRLTQPAETQQLEHKRVEQQQKRWNDDHEY